MTCKSIISTFHSFLNAAGFFRRNVRSEGAAEGGGGGNSAAPERSAGAKRRRSFVRIRLVKSSDFVQETQPKNRIAVFAKMRSVAKRRDWGFRENPPRVFEIQKKRAGREAGVRANLFEKISFGFEIFFGSDNYGLVTV